MSISGIIVDVEIPTFWSTTNDFLMDYNLDTIGYSMDERAQSIIDEF